MRTNHARRQVSCLVRHHDTGDGRMSPDAAMRIRKSIYCALAEVVRDAESISQRLPTAGKALASEIRRDAAWAYRATRDMATVLDTPECALPHIDLLPDMSSEVAPPVNAQGTIDMPDAAPRDTGPLTKRLRQTGVYLRLYTLAVSHKDTMAAQDLRAAIHDSLEDIDRRVAARTDDLRGFGLRSEAEAVKEDWAWVPKVLAPIAKALLHDGVREKSMDDLIAEEILPVVQDIAETQRCASPSGLWSKKMAEHLAREDAAQKQGNTGRAWERFRNGFRPGRKHVGLRKETELHPSGGGGGLGMFEFNELGHIRRVVDASGNSLEPMVYISHLRCPECAAFTEAAAGECPKCGGCMDVAQATPKSHVPMASIPEIAGAGAVRCPAGEILLAGAIREIWEAARERCAVIHMSKSESKQVRSQGGPMESMSLVQWLGSGGTSWVKRDDLRLLAKQVFVYGPAIMDTTIGQARFCFGAWVDFGDIDIQDSPPKFELGDEVEVTDAKLMRYETAVIGGKSGEALQVSGTCAGVVVRVPSRATDQTEPMYDVRIGDTVIMHQVESSLRLQRGKRGEPNPAIRRMAHRSYNAFDAEGYKRYRNRC